jgi:hypothetical protein
MKGRRLKPTALSRAPPDFRVRHAPAASAEPEVAHDGFEGGEQDGAQQRRYETSHLGAGYQTRRQPEHEGVHHQEEVQDRPRALRPPLAATRIPMCLPASLDFVSSTRLAAASRQPSSTRCSRSASGIVAN